MTKLFTLAAAGLGALAPLAAAHADTFTESVRFGTGPTDFANATGTTAGPGGTQLYFFDTNGGTLNAITFQYSYGFTSTITVTNSASTNGSGNGRTESGARFSSNDAGVTAALNTAVNTGGDVAFGTTVLSPAAVDLLGTRSIFNLAPGGSTSFASNGTFASSLTSTSASVLAAFSRAGGGTFTPLFSTLTGTVLSINSGNVGASQVTTAQGNLTISYNYTAAAPVAAVPEPASWAMMVAGFGLVGAGLRRRRTGAGALVR